MPRRTGSPRRLTGPLDPARVSATSLSNFFLRLTLSVMCPATPSSNPYLPKIRKAAANRPLRYARSLYGSSNLGGLGSEGIFTLASTSGISASRGTSAEGLVDSWLGVSIAEGGAMVMQYVDGLPSRKRQKGVQWKNRDREIHRGSKGKGTVACLTISQRRKSQRAISVQRLPRFLVIYLSLPLLHPRSQQPREQDLMPATCVWLHALYPTIFIPIQFVSWQGVEKDD
jgi:hypothetical protein